MAHPSAEGFGDTPVLSSWGVLPARNPGAPSSVSVLLPIGSVLGAAGTGHTHTVPSSPGISLLLLVLGGVQGSAITFLAVRAGSKSLGSGGTISSLPAPLHLPVHQETTFCSSSVG